MQFYILTLTYFKTAKPQETITTKTLLLTQKHDIIREQLQKERKTIYKFLSEIMDCQESEIQETAKLEYVTGNTLGYIYKTTDFIATLEISTITYEPPQNPGNIKSGMYATIKEDAKDNLPSALQGAQIVWISRIENQRARVNVQVTKSSNLGMSDYIPVDYLQEYIL